MRANRKKYLSLALLATVASVVLVGQIYPRGDAPGASVGTEPGRLGTSNPIAVSSRTAEQSPHGDDPGTSPVKPTDPGIPADLDAKRHVDGDVMAEWGEFVVYRRIATNCRFVVLRTPTLDSAHTSVWTCDAITVPDHPYADLSVEQLKLIADSDGVAALILGTRLRDEAETADDYKEAIQYLYSAVALTGEPEVYEVLMNEQGILLGTHSNIPEQDLAAKSEAYVWAKAGNDLGLIDNTDLRRARKAITEVAPEEAVEKLDTAAWQLAEQFKNERLQRLGEQFL